MVRATPRTAAPMAIRSSKKKTPKGLCRKAAVSLKNIISWQQALQLFSALQL
jgi:hypothetical protein